MISPWPVLQTKCTFLFFLTPLIHNYGYCWYSFYRYMRMPRELLPTVIKSLQARTEEDFSSKMDQTSLLVSILNWDYGGWICAYILAFVMLFLTGSYNELFDRGSVNFIPLSARARNACWRNIAGLVVFTEFEHASHLESRRTLICFISSQTLLCFLHLWVHERLLVLFFRFLKDSEGIRCSVYII